MVAGHNSKALLNDLKYNVTSDHLYKLTQTKKVAEQKLNEIRKKGFNWSDPTYGLPKEEFEALQLLGKINSPEFIPSIVSSIYNQQNGYETVDDSYKSGNLSKELYDALNLMGHNAKYKSGSALDTSIDAIHEYVQQFGTSYVSEEEVESEADAISEMTCSDEDNEEEPKSTDEKKLEAMKGYAQLKKWLKQITAITSQTKVLKQMTKYSDLAKVSASEYIRPKTMFMKKLMNKEFYCRQSDPQHRIIHTMIDFSGSMREYQSWRNALMTRVFNDCTKANIDMYNCFWNTHLHSVSNPDIPKERFIKTTQELETHVLKREPRGDDNMGRCVVEKLQQIQRSSIKQYLLCISDGTGSIEDSEQRKQIQELAIAKNIELKFALFSSSNDMQGMPLKDIFYIFKS